MTIGRVSATWLFVLTCAIPAVAQENGTINGTVTDAVTHVPIEGVRITIFPSVEVFTNAAGVYVASVPAGLYSLRASKRDYALTYYPDFDCRHGCTGSGTVVTVTAGTTTTANFALVPLATISGTLSDASTGAPIVSGTGVDVLIAAFDTQGRQASTEVETDAGGKYTIHFLDPGSYYIRAHAIGYVRELHANLHCIAADCRPVSGTPVTVDVGTARTGIDFALDPQGVITGTVRAASSGAPVNVELKLYNAATSEVQTTNAGFAGSLPTGVYRFDGLPAGDYYIRARGTAGDTRFVPQLFGGVPCRPTVGNPTGCRIASGTRVHVNSGATTSGIDFSLTSTGSISGTVRAADGTPIAGATVEALDGPGTAGSARSAQDGRFTIAALPPGKYRARAFAPDFVARALDGSVVVTGGAETANTDFSLSAGGAITGTIRYDLGVAGGFHRGWRYGGGGTIVAYDVHGRFVRNAELVITGSPITVTDPIQYTIDGLPDGTYFLRYESVASHSASVFLFFTGTLVEQIYGAGSCVTVDCDVRRGAPVAVTGGGIVGNIDFQLERGTGFLSVLPTDEVYDARGVRVHARRHEARFHVYGFDQVTGLPAGTYYVRRPGGRLHAGIECADCPATAGTPVISTRETPISLPAGSRSISGTVRAAAGGSPLSTIAVTAYSESGTAEASGMTDMLGIYRIAGLAPGRYFLKTTNDRGFVDKAYSSTTCVDCDPRVGDAIDLTGADATGRDLALDAAALVEGVVADSQGVTLDGAPLAFFDSSGAVAGRTRTSNTGAYAIQLPGGTYYARSEPIQGFSAQMYKAQPCAMGNCDPRNGTPIVASVSAPATNVDFALGACAAPSLSPALLASGVEGVPYRQVVIASEGVPPYRYVVTAGFLPLGLRLDAESGVLSGTPAGSGTHNFTIAATGGGTDCAGARMYTLHVSQCAFTIAPSSATAGSAGAGITVTLGNACGDRTVTPGASWLHASMDAAGTTVTINVDPNATEAVRAGNVLIGRRVFTVRQAGIVSTAPFGSLDTPGDGQQVSGSVAISGWALDDLGVSRVRIVRDALDNEPRGQVFIGDAVFVTGARPDVERLHAGVPFNARAGWGYLLLTNMLPAQGNGLFRVYAYADDGEGHSTLLGSRTIVCVNAAATTPFGAIDTPAQGEAVGGQQYFNWGWALTPRPKSIATDGSTIQVLVDGVPVGGVTYNLFRPDVAGLFPGLANSTGPIGYRAIDTTALAEGLHTIAWLVTDSSGAATGIGSRYFAVNNSSDNVVPVSGASGGFASASRVTFTDGERRVEVPRLGRIVLPLADAHDASCATSDGYLQVDGELRALPVGSSLDRAGTFYWQPGPAFSGTYQLVFVRTACDGTRTRLPVTVVIK